MFAKLLENGISSKLINIFKSLYSKMKLGVKHDISNRKFSSNVGVLQGDVCSPAFFSLFINDLPNCLSVNLLEIRVVDILIKILMFADDMAIFSTTREGLQAGLKDLESYCKKWGLILNTEKTKIVVFRKGGKLSKEDKWEFKGNNIEVVPSFRYLGCHLSSGGSVKLHINNIVDSARRGLFALKQYISTNPEILMSLQLERFDIMIKPNINLW
jgi:Reverse transcriptase (RNA-dependent DNA polymerase).